VQSMASLVRSRGAAGFSSASVHSQVTVVILEATRSGQENV